MSILLINHVQINQWLILACIVLLLKRQKLWGYSFLAASNTAKIICQYCYIIVYDNNFNDMISHLTETIDNIFGDKVLTNPNVKLNGIPTCNMNDCFSIPITRCILCSKYYCYTHVQLCFQTHQNEIEIIKKTNDL